MNNKDTYSYEEVYKSTLNYFRGDTLATDVWISKYCLKDNRGNYYEKDPDQMHRRMAAEFARIEEKYGSGKLSEQEIYELFKDFKYIIPQGSPMAGIGNDLLITSLSNCFVVDNPHDSYPGILKTEQQLISIMKRRGGVGLSIHSLRPKDMPTTSVSEKSSGVVLFSERYSRATREVAQDGRRGALMISCKVDHPDIVEFIEAKTDLQKITGANVSVMITDDFMKALRGNKDYEVIFSSPKGEVRRMLNARGVWGKIIKNAWKSAEPGVLFWDTILRESPADCYPEDGFRTTSTNPCFTGETVVAVADGRNGVTIKELADKGVNFPVYSARRNKSTGSRSGGWKAEIKNAFAFKTGTRKIVELVLSDGSSFRCTPDHLLALPDGSYIEARHSEGVVLSKFYSFSNKDSKKSYRHINSISNGYSRQYKMLWNYWNGFYDGKKFNIDHIDGDSTNDNIENLKILSVEDHKKQTKRVGCDNPINKISKERLSYLQKKKNIFANAKKYSWDDERLYAELSKFEENNEKPEIVSNNVYLNEEVWVEEIIDNGVEEEVYDLNVDDNHNFYIITKTDDEKFLNSSGVLVHNCGEIPLCPGDSCRLMALNLFSYVKNPFQPNSEFDFDLFKEHVYKAQKLMDDMVDLEIEKIDKVINKIKNDDDPEELKSVELDMWLKIRDMAVKGRRTGLGVTAEGDMLAALGLIYGTEEATDFAEKLHKEMSIFSYISSIVMAQDRGCFPVWDKEKEGKNPFINRILGELNPEILKIYNKYGRRNIANLTIAPTGSVSLMTQTTSGVEPVFLPYYKRRRKVNEVERASFVDDTGDMWEEYNVFHPKFKLWFDLNWYKLNPRWFDINYKPDLEELGDEELSGILKKSPYFKATSNDVNWVEKVRMQGKIQKWVDHSISVTVNVPEQTSVTTVDKIYMTAYESGCKGCTIYRDGSRSGVLVSNKKEKFEYVEAIKRPREVECDIYTKTALGKDFTVLVGLVDGKPYEIFAFEQLNQSEFPREIKKGKIFKVKKQHYRLTGIKGDREYVIDNIISQMGDDERTNTRKYSLYLRHRIKPLFVSEQIEKYAMVTSFDKVISRVLKNYTNGEVREQCEICGGKLKMSDGCMSCVDCGWTKC